MSTLFAAILSAVLLALGGGAQEISAAAAEPFCDHCQAPGLYEVKLNLPAAERWAPLARAYRKELLAAREMISEFVPKDLRALFEDLAADVLLKYVGVELGQEMQGISSASGLSLGDTVLLNIIYEVEAGCTSIVTADHVTGRIIHGRNLDFSLAPLLRNMTVQVNFTRGGAVQYRGTTYAGYVGLLTGMKPGKGGFSLSADQRHSGDVWENLAEALFVNNATAAAWLMRRTLADPSLDFSGALKTLATHPVVAPIYIIVGGLSGASNEGAIITRDRNSAANVWQLDAASGRWFEVETNWDHWKKAGDDRRKTANDAMTKIGQKHINLKGIETVLSTVPVLNTHTTYTTLMSAATDSYDTHVRTL